MNQIKTKHGPGLIGTISGDLSRYPANAQSLMRLMVPQGSSWRWVQGNGFALNRNLIVQQMKPEHEWLWFVDDDNSFKPDLLMHLLERNVDMVQPLVTTKKPPFQPYVYRYNEQTGDFISPDWYEVPDGISEWDATATGGLLIRRHVLDAVGYPWFEEGKTSPDGLGEDLYFSRKAVEKGFKCYVDADHRMAHWNPISYTPARNMRGEWVIEVDLHQGITVDCPTSVGKERKLQKVGASPIAHIPA